MMGLAVAEASRAVDAFVARHKAAGQHHDVDVAGWGKTDALKGLVAMATLYLKLGHDYAEGASYPKAIAALMARTDFEQLFRMLPDDQRIALCKQNSRLWLELMRDASGLAQLDQPLLCNAPWPVRLTCELWLSHLPRGIDLLTSEGYQLLAAAMLESMGSMGAKTQGVGEARAAIFELRAIPDMFPYTEIPKIANALAKCVADLNNGKKVNFKM